MAETLAAAAAVYVLLVFPLNHPHALVQNRLQLLSQLLLLLARAAG
jgi:hypothetical protein